MKLFDKYIKTATYGATYTQRFKRILFLFCLFVWTLGAVWLYEPTKGGVIGLKDYYEEKSYIEGMKSVYDRYDRAKFCLKEMHPNDTLTKAELDMVSDKNKPLPAWLEEKVDRREKESEVIYRNRLDKLKQNLWGLLAIPAYIVIFFVLPWLLIRLIFWIKTADNAKRI